MSASAIRDEITSSTRFSPVTETDHAGYVWIVTILGVTYTTLACLLRGWVKFRVYGLDDLLIAAGTVFHLVQAIFVFLALSSGLAKSNTITDPADSAAASQAFFAAKAIGFVILGLSKCSSLALTLRLVSPGTGKSATWHACIIMIIGPNVKNDVLAWRYDRLLGITIPDIITDVLVCLLPLWATVPLNMAKGVKFKMSLAFSFRILVVPQSALCLFYFGVAAKSTDTQFAITKSILAEQAAIAFSLISATVPNLRIFITSFDSGFNLPALVNKIENSYELQNITGGNMNQKAQVCRIASGDGFSLDGTGSRDRIFTGYGV
ncbi:hypothetical protein PG985_005681 [Apiospora marii]|uniref:uncharacterized protein n=1 Tax=Apiospora marii TaxID=335849 RepID=UPI00312F937F